MRIEFKLFFLKRIVLDFGMKEPDFITAEAVKQYSKKDELTPKLRSVHKKLKFVSRRYNHTELRVDNLTASEIGVLRRRGFSVKSRTKMKKGETIFLHDHYLISVN